MLSFFIFCGCSGIVKRIARVNLPASVKEMRAKKQVAILDFDQEVSNSIKNAVIKGKLHNVVDESDVSGANILYQGGNFDTKYGSKVEKDLVKIKKSCSKRGKSKGKRKGKCLKWRPASQYYNYTLTETCHAKVPCKITDVSTGKTLQVKTVKQSVTNQNTKAKQQPDAIGSDRLCGVAKDAAVKVLISMITPRWENVTFEFLEISEDIAEQAIGSAQIGNIDRSIKLYKTIINNATVEQEAKARAHYNIAHIESIMYNYDSCVHHASISAEILPENEYVLKLFQKCRELK
jgi:hypothetical protein